MNSRYRAIILFFLLAALAALFPPPSARAAGNAGDIIWNPNTRMPQYCDGTKWVGMPPFKKSPNYQAYGRLFDDGTADYEGGIAASGVTVTGSFWFRRAGNYGVLNYIYAIADQRNNGRTYFAITITAADKIRIFGARSNGTLALDITGSTAIQDNLWHHVLFSADLSAAQTAGKNPSIYIDDVAETVTVTTFTNNAMDFANANGGGFVGILYTGNGVQQPNGFYGGLSDFWLKGGAGAYIDFSVTANRRSFIDANKKPVNIGSGGTAAGLAPDGWLCCSSDINNFANIYSDWAHDVWHEPWNQTVRGPSSNSITLTKLQTLTGASMSSTGQVAIQGNYAYVTDETNGKFNVINISNPSSMSVAGTLTDATAFPAGRQTWGVAVEGNYAYVCANGLITVDVSNPAAPTKVGTLSDTRVCSGGGVSYGNPIALKGKYLYTQNGESPDYFAVIDKSTPTALSIVSAITVGDYDDDGMVVSGDYAYMTGNGNLSVVDITNPTAPYVVSTTALANGTQTGMAIDQAYGNLLYLTGNQNLFEPINISSKTAPVDPGWNGFIYPPSQSTLVMKGIAVSGNRLYVASNSASPVLFVYDITDPANPQYLVDSTNATCSGCRGIAVKGNYIFTTLETGGGLISWQLTEGGTTCASPAGKEGDVIYNGGANHVMQFCDGSNWQPLGPVPGATTGSTCNNPSGNEGDFIFNQDYRVMQYCDSKLWMSVGTPAYNPLPLAPTSGLIHWWKLDDTYGSGTAADSAGSATITMSGTSSFNNVAEYGSGALYFPNDGTAKLNNVTTPADMLGKSAVTLSMWYKRAQAGSYLSVGQENLSNSGDEISIEVFGDGNVYYSLSDGSQRYGSIVNNDTNWHLATLVFDGTLSGDSNRLKAYLDGVQQTLSWSNGGVPAVTTSNPFGFYIGNLGSLGYTDSGRIDDVRVYNRALSATEVSNLFKATASVNDPVGWWKFDESSGTVASESSGYANPGTLNYLYNGYPTWQPTGGKINGGLKFDGGSAQYVQVNDAASLDLATSFSVSAWVYLTALPGAGQIARIVDKEAAVGTNYELNIDNGYFGSGLGFTLSYNSAGCCDDNYVKYVTSISTNTWYNVTAVYDSVAQTQTMYINGAASATHSVAGLPPQAGAGNPLYMGSRSGNDALSGVLDDVRVYNRALSASEVSAIYSGVSGGTCP